ncbi:MAG: ribbon-helix-helix protein, CopG family [Candidatus Bathyarchaeales archaeon]
MAKRGRPPKRVEEKCLKVTVTMPARILAIIDAMAEKTDSSRSEVMSSLLRLGARLMAVDLKLFFSMVDTLREEARIEGVEVHE